MPMGVTADFKESHYTYEILKSSLKREKKTADMMRKAEVSIHNVLSKKNLKAAFASLLERTLNTAKRTKAQEWIHAELSEMVCDVHAAMVLN